MGVKASKVKFILDAEDSVTLRDVEDGAVTATTTEVGVSLKELDTAYWHEGEIPHGVFAVALNVSAIDLSSANETYQISLLVDDTADMSDNAVEIAAYTIRSAGFYTFYVDSKTIPALDPDTSGTDKWLAVRATLGGTTPSISYGAWLAKNIRQ